MKVVLFSLVAAILALAAADNPPVTPIVIDQIVAKVNGDIVSQDELQRLVRERSEEMKAQGANGRQLEQGVQELEKNLLRDRIDQLLLVQKGKELNISVDPEISKYLASLRRQSGITDEEKFREYVREKSGMTYEDFQAEAKNNALTREVIGSEVGRHIHVSNDEIEAYYNSHKQDFIRDEKVYLSEILISTQGKDTAGIAAAEKKAKQLSEDAGKGQRFPDMARDNSDAATAKDGGALGGYKKGELTKEIEDAVWNLPKGSVTKPMKLANGFEIFKVDDHTKQGLAPLPDVKADIENVLYGPKMQPKVREYLTTLRTQAFLQVKPGFIDTGAAPGMDTRWQDPAVLKPETVKKAEVEQKQRMKRLLWTIPVPGTSVDVNGKSSSR
jgi:peptidyl-prolyl cis-trans isomerase SurA